MAKIKQNVVIADNSVDNQNSDNQPVMAIVTKVQKVATPETLAKRELRKAEKSIVAANFADKMLLSDFRKQLEQIEAGEVKAALYLSNVSFINNYNGMHFLHLPTSPKFSQMFDATNEGLMAAQKLVSDKQFKGTQLLVYTKSGKGQICGKVSDFVSIDKVFETYHKIKVIPYSERYVKDSRLSLSEAFKLASKAKAEALLSVSKAKSL